MTPSYSDKFLGESDWVTQLIIDIEVEDMEDCQLREKWNLTQSQVDGIRWFIENRTEVND